MAAGERNAVLLSSTACLAVVQEILEVAEAHRCRSILGATAAGNMLVGAALLAAEGRLSLWRAGQPGCVLVIDGVTTSMISVRAAIRRALLCGATAAVGVIVDFPESPVEAEEGIVVLGVADSVVGQRDIDSLSLLTPVVA